jgi:UDP-sulfoquinovose synthase
VQLIRAVRPKAIVHFAEQRAAPYSMKSPRHQAVHRRQQHQRHPQRATGRDRGDRASTCIVVHLGTMGVYGYGSRRGAAIPGGLPDGGGSNPARTDLGPSRFLPAPIRAASIT